MKRILVVLIVSIFTFALFAETGEASTTLTLNAEVAGKLYHGFTAADNATADDIKSDVSGAGSGNYTAPNLDLEIDSAQAIGYYNLYTTGSAQATVKFTVNPLTVDVDGTAGADYYVPYQLGYTAGSAGNIAPSASGTIGSATVATTTAPSAATPVTVLTTTGNGLRYQTLALTATFAGTSNISFGLPESTAYTGTIVAAVTAE